jgi:hypothetical protein
MSRATISGPLSDSRVATEEARRLGLELLEEEPGARDLGQDLAIGRARDSEPHRARRPVARQADHAHIVREVLAPELGPDAGLVAELLHLLLELEVAEGASELVARGRQRVQVTRARELHRLERELRRRAPDHERQVIGRAGGGAERSDLLGDEAEQRLRVQQRLGLLVEEGLVGRATPLGYEEQVVLVARLGVDLDLRRQVRAGVLLAVHVERRHLRVAQVALLVGAVDAARERTGVVRAGEDPLPLVPDDDGGASVLTAGQHAAGRDVRVLQQLERDEAVVVGRLGVAQDLGELLQVARAQQVRDVVHGVARQTLEPLGLDAQQPLPVELELGDTLRAERAVLRGIGTELEDLLVLEVGHRASALLCSAAQSRGVSSLRATPAA